MSVSPSISPIPADTNQAAKAVYSRDNFFLIVGDRLSNLLAGVNQDGIHPARLSFRRERPPLTMVTIFQFIEMLPDSQAAESTRARIDWKYALHLSMNYPGLPANALCEYRQWALQEPAQLQDLQLILQRMMRTGLLGGYQEQVVTASAVLDEVCSVTRLDRAYKSMESAIKALATHRPSWLQDISLPHWVTRYHVFNSSQPLPLVRADRNAFTEAIGADIYYLLDCFAGDTQPELASVEEIQALHQVWHEQFEYLSTCNTKLMERCSFCGETVYGPQSGHIERNFI